MVTKKTDVETFANKADVQSWDDALQYLQEQGFEVQSSEVIEQALGDGFAYVDKSALVNIPFVILDAKKGYSTNFDTPMVTVWAMTATNKRVKFIDMSTGVSAQLASAMERGYKPQGMMFKEGLTASDYEIEVDGKMTKARTFYLSV